MIGRYITLEELMKRFDPQLSVLCIQLSELAGAADAFLFLKRNATLQEREQALVFPAKQVPSLLQLVTAIAEECQKVALPYSALGARSVLMAMSGPNMQAAEFQFRCRELLRRIEDELRARVLFSIAPDKQQFVTALNLFGAEVTTAFPSASYDIEEAAHCLAFDRWTAAVFHLARAAEIATVIIGRQVGYQSPKEGFGGVLRYMDNGLRKAREHHKEADPLFTGDLEFLSGVTAQMHAVNQAWRQRVSHMDKKYTEEEAIRIWDATKGLMQHLASKLKEEPSD